MLATRGTASRASVPRVGQRQRRAVRGREAASSRVRTPVTLSDSGGFVHDPDGIDREKLAWVMELKNDRRGRIGEYAERLPARDVHAARPPRTTTRSGRSRPSARSPARPRTRSTASDAATLLANGVAVVCEGANMPTTPDGVERFLDAGHPLRPGEGGERGRRRRVRAGDVAGRAAALVAARGGRRAAARHHEGDPRAVPRDR